MARNRTNKNANRSRKPPARPVEASGRGREVIGIIGLGLAIFAVLGLLSLQLGDGNLMGPLGRGVAMSFYRLLGLTAYAAIGGLGLIAVRLLMNRMPLARGRHLLGAALAMICTASLSHLFGAGYRVDAVAPGGLVGEHVAEIFRALISTAGTTLLALLGLVVAAVVATPLRVSQIAEVLHRGWSFIAMGGRVAGRGAAYAGTEAARFSGEVIRAVLPEREYDDYLDDEEYDDPAFMDSSAPEEALEDATERHDSPPVLYVDEPKKKKKSKAKVEPTVADAGDTLVEDAATLVAAAEEAVDQGDAGAEIVELKPKKKGKKSKTAAAEPSAELVEESAEVLETEAGGADEVERAEPVIVERQLKKPNAEDMAKLEAEVDAERLDFIPLGDGAYQLPPLHLLDYDESQEDSIDRAAMLELSARLTKTLEDYGVKGEVTAIRPGPVVTMYEFAPAPGTRLNKIVNLTDDLAMSLEALRVRIVAPIPGKAAVGIEVPNKKRETVYFKEVIADDSFAETKFKLPLAMGKDIEGRPNMVDLAKMPHLLVAGTTGSGKSVSVNSMITSLLYHSTPEEVRLIMVDPKMLELSIYEGVPHLLLPVVTDPKKANLALRWAVDEMERRYGLLASMGVRDISSYNKKIDKIRKQFEADRLQRAADEAARLADEDADEILDHTEEREPLKAEDLEPPKTLPFIVVIIDEFADLMMVASKEVETSVARIAQKARAAGIHLILATQRPSVDVITGLIKANFPSRVAFHVTSKIDSRTILDQTGAEALLGSGDMLFSDRGASPKRIHGCFIDEEEIHRVVAFLKTQGKPVYNLDILKPREEEGGELDGGGEDEPMDDMYDRAVAIVSETQNVSISMIQRRLRIGYNRAARIVEHMEREGVVSAPDGTNKREVLIAPAA